MIGLFVTFEGVEGAGKSSQAKMLREALINRGMDVLLTREPGGDEIAEQIRGIILSEDNNNMHPLTEAYLYAAARAQHVNNVIMPQLERGGVVICDRFIDSSLAYQGYARGLGNDRVWEINRIAIGDIMPDVTFLIDLEPEEGFRRKTGDKLDRIETAGLDFHCKVAEGYRVAQAAYPARIKLIDGALAAEQIHSAILAYLIDNQFIE